MLTPLACALLLSSLTVAVEDPASTPPATPAEPPTTADTPNPPVPPVSEASEPPGPPARVDLVAPAAAAAAAAGAPFDAAAEELYRSCTKLFDAARIDEAHACFLNVSATARGSEAALKADAALMILDAHLAPPTPAGIIPAGRLGFSTALGLFGAWNAVAGGIIVETQAPQIPQQIFFLGTGLGAVAVGIGSGVGGYFLADALKLDEGAARLVGSSLVWGTALGTAMAPTVAEALQPAANPNTPPSATALPVDAAIATVVLGGYAVGGAALLTVSNVKLDEAQVGLINSGGIVGSVVGLALLPNLAAVGVSSTPIYSFAYVGSTVLGLAAGAALGQVVDATWGEVLVCDLGGALGFIGGAAVGLASSNLQVGTIALAGGTILGYGVTLGIVTHWRGARGAPVKRDGPDLRPVALSLVDLTGKSVAGVGFGGSL